MIKKILLANVIVALGLVSAVVRPVLVSAQTAGSAELNQEISNARAKRGNKRDHAKALLRVLEVHFKARKERESRDRLACGKVQADEIRRVNDLRKAKVDELKKRIDSGENVETIVAEIKKLRDDRADEFKYRAAFIRCHLDKARTMVKKATDRANTIERKLNELSLESPKLSDLTAKLTDAKAKISDAEAKVLKIEELLNVGDMTEAKLQEIKGYFETIRVNLDEAYKLFKAIAQAVRAS